MSVYATNQRFPQPPTVKEFLQGAVGNASGRVQLDRLQGDVSGLVLVTRLGFLVTTALLVWQLVASAGPGPQAPPERPAAVPGPAPAGAERTAPDGPAIVVTGAAAPSPPAPPRSEPAPAVAVRPTPPPPDPKPAAARATDPVVAPPTPRPATKPVPPKSAPPFAQAAFVPPPVLPCPVWVSPGRCVSPLTFYPPVTRCPTPVVMSPCRW